MRRCGRFVYHCASATPNTVMNYVSPMHETYHSNSYMPGLANPQMTSSCAFSKQWIIDNIRGPIRKCLGWCYDNNSTKRIRMMDWSLEVGSSCLDTFIPEALSNTAGSTTSRTLLWGIRRLVCHFDSSHTLPSKVLLIRGKELQSFEETFARCCTFQQITGHSHEVFILLHC